ncbi:MAG: hypothetical protein ACI4RT_03570 [Candidatus Spyradenecus sp.]
MSAKTISRAKVKASKASGGVIRKADPTPKERADSIAWLKRYGAIFNKDETRIVGVRLM